MATNEEILLQALQLANNAINNSIGTQVGFTEQPLFNTGTQVFDRQLQSALAAGGLTGVGGVAGISGIGGAAGGIGVPSAAGIGGFGSAQFSGLGGLGPPAGASVGGLGVGATTGPTGLGNVSVGAPRTGGTAQPGTQIGPPGSLGNGASPLPRCTYRIGKIKELKGGDSGDLFNGPDFVNINKRCILIGELYKCCNTNPNGEVFIGWVELARSTSNKFYRACKIDGVDGRQAVVEHYYDLSSLGPVAVISDTLDSNGNTRNISVKNEDGPSTWSNTPWSDKLCGTQPAVEPGRYINNNEYTTFSEYFAARFPATVTIIAPDGTSQSRKIESNKPIYKEASSPDFIAGRVIKASCGGNGPCVRGAAPPPGPRPPEKDCNTTIKVPIPGKRSTTPTSTTEEIIGDSFGLPGEQKVPIPNMPCMLGFKRQARQIQTFSQKYGFACVDRLTGAVTYDEASVEDRLERIEGQVYDKYILVERDPNCPYEEKEEERDGGDDPANRCFGLIVKDIYRKYADDKSKWVLHQKGVFVRYYRKQDEECAEETIRVYHPLNLGRDVITARVKANTKGLFNGSQTLECHHTSSTQTTQNSASKEYYYEITDCDNCGRTPYFAVTYGNLKGSGSLHIAGEIYDTNTKAIYSQYRLIALDEPNRVFNFTTNGVVTSSRDIYAINFYRNGLSDRLDPGNFELALAELNGGAYANNVHTGSNVAISSSNKVFTFIDDSQDRSDSVSCAHDPYLSYNIISGTLDGGAYETGSDIQNTYGIVYPNLGIMVLDPYKLNTELGFNTVTGSNIDGDNHYKLFKSISGSSVLGHHMKARNVHYKATNHYFVRVASTYTNYSSNPTYVVSGSEGEFLHGCFRKRPQTYITTIGLYNDFNELLAVAKLSKAIEKSFDNDVLIKIRLNW